MLVVKLEVHPGGDSSRAYQIGEARIANVAVSDYTFELTALDHTRTVSRMVTGHTRTDGAWRLVQRALNRVFRSGQEPFR